ncbi:MAG: RluA family pseudouridine synthase [Nitriliruptorales bacterium]|nr:RluA family pseudouridine synthase [Nitriliruptorales bacterium]
MLLERVVDPADDDVRVDVLLARWLDESRGRVQQRLDAGLVRVDGAVCSKSRRVQVGERVTVEAEPDKTQVPAPAPVPVRYEDEDLAVVAKPAGLVVHRGAGTRGSPTLVESLQAMGMTLAPGDDADRPGVVHRLDRGTSGLLVVAKSEQARVSLVATFRRHDVDRRYWAIVDGVPQPSRATVEAPIARSGRKRTKFTVSPRGRPAVTHYDVEEPFGRASLLRVRLETGRTHQVRVHMAAVGHPVSGDAAYGASSTVARDLGLQRPALHATRLAFAHPMTGKRVTVDEPPPPDLVEAHRRLRGAPPGDK